MLTALVDTDPVVYSAGFAVEKKQPDGGKLVEPLSHALQCVRQLIASIQANVAQNALGFGVTEVNYKYYLTGPGNYRDKLATIKKYKGNRDPLHKPFWYKEIRQYLQDRYAAVVVSGWEADDQVAMEQWQAPPETTVICTADKDLLMVPGLHYNYNKKVGTIISFKDALKAFYMQLLTGDTTDNIGGCYKVGKKKAAQILDGLEHDYELYAACLTAYETSLNKYGDVYKGLNAKEALLENARLLWMQQYPGQLWVPPGEPPAYLPGFEP